MAKKKEANDFSFRPFKNLGTIIVPETVDSTPDSSSASEACPDDEELFLAEMKGVREIKEFRRLPVHRKVPAPVRMPPDSDSETLKTLEEISEGRRPIRLSDTQEYVEWANARSGCAAAVACKLHEGRFAVQDFLDLHGFTVEEAEDRIGEFLAASLRKGLRCVKIIHGRGLKSPKGPVLKESLVKWLSGRYRRNVIAFATARRCDGGLGALYVLLRQHRSRKKLL
ncbi:MAG TPA: Smr/MutS family protein [Dissulfurispiraceae bacterium]|nr:Smr/MutS family protein [Dissulfurispiraceae bacterium]